MGGKRTFDTDGPAKATTACSTKTLATVSLTNPALRIERPLSLPDRLNVVSFWVEHECFITGGPPKAGRAVVLSSEFHSSFIKCIDRRCSVSAEGIMEPLKCGLSLPLTIAFADPESDGRVGPLQDHCFELRLTLDYNYTQRRETLLVKGYSYFWSAALNAKVIQHG